MQAGHTAGRNTVKDPEGVAPCRAGLRGERRPPRTVGGLRQRDDLRAGSRLRPRVSDHHGEADETARSGGSVKRSRIRARSQQAGRQPYCHITRTGLSDSRGATITVIGPCRIINEPSPDRQFDALKQERPTLIAILLTALHSYDKMTLAI